MYSIECGNFPYFFNLFSVFCNVSVICCRIPGSTEVYGNTGIKRVVGGYILLVERYPEMLFQVLKICNSIINTFMTEFPII